MSLLQQLGLGSLGMTSPDFQQQALLANAYNAYQQLFPRTCIHTDCPQCKEASLKIIAEQKTRDWEQARKKEDYEKRCRQYMKKLHKIKGE